MVKVMCSLEQVKENGGVQKEKAIISPAHLPNPFNTQTKSTLDVKSVLFCTFSFVHKNTQRHMKEDYYILVLVLVFHQT